MIFDIIAAVGSLATFGAFLMLFRRDGDKQSQIDKLTNIAILLESQNESMKEHNELVALQVDIFRNTSILKGQDNDAINQLRVIEEKKLKLSVKPIFDISDISYNKPDGELTIHLYNKGEEAEILEIIFKSEDIKLSPRYSFPYNLDKGSSFYISGVGIQKKLVSNSNYEIDITFEDALGYKYISKLKGTGLKAKIVNIIEIDN